jgi:hypothetical protein
VRAGAVGTIPAASLAFAKSITAPTTLTVVSAPSAAATVRINNGSATPASGDDSATLTSSLSSLGSIFGTVVGDDTVIGLSADTAGSYTARLSNGADTVTFSFVTTGAPTSLALTPATQTVLVGAEGALVATLKDASGNVTQPAVVDSVALSDNTDDTLSTATLTSANLAKGTAAFTLATTGNPAGTTTITATPQGTLPGTGVTAASATVTKSGTISTTTIAGMAVTVPSVAVNAGTAPSTSTAAIPEGTTAVTVTIDDTTAAAAGNSLRIKAVLSAGTLDGSSTLTKYTDVTTNSSKKATVSYTIGGAGLVAGATLTVSQVNVANSAVSPAGQITVAQTAAVAAMTTSPDDSQVAALGATVPVTVTIKDQYGNPYAGYVVRSYRGAVSAPNLLSAGTTNSAGVATVTVTNASGATSGTSENYSFTATPPGSSTATITENNTLTVAYTTGGGITGLSVAVGTAGTTTPITNSTTSIAVLPLQVVPYGGTAATQTTGTFTVSGSSASAGNSGNVSLFTPTATPANNVTVTVGTGVKVSTTASTVWSGGAQSITVPSGTPVYVFATKAGTHDVTFTSGGLTATPKVVVGTAAAAAYDISITPAAQDIAKGGFGTATVSLTDVFGNAVPGASGTNNVSVVAAGEVLLGGFSATQTVTVGADGKGTVTVIAGNTTGAGTLTVTPASGQSAAAWAAGYTPPTGAPAPKVSAVATVAVGTGPVTKTITITGSRTTVSGKPGIEIDGVVSGIEDGKTVIPYFRFPGETTFTEGSARPVITDGSFVWQRKTGKKFYAYVTNDDGSTTSNRVIIPAN